MSNVEKISVALTPEMAETIRKAVEGGDYASSSEVVREALRDWKRKRAFEEKEIDALRRLWTEGQKSGPGRFSDVKAIKAEARRRLDRSQDQD